MAVHPPQHETVHQVEAAKRLQENGGAKQQQQQQQVDVASPAVFPGGTQ
jgi:hypothetical protein